MTPERFPAAVDLRTKASRLENQGQPETCRAFAITTALETAYARAGKPVQLSVRFLWFHGVAYRGGMEGMARALRFGVCRDELWPYDPANLDAIPPKEAYDDALVTLPSGRIEPIFGKIEIMRTLAQGSPVPMIGVMPGGWEHAECIVGYDSDGVIVHGSYNDMRTDPWSRVETNGISRTFRLRDLCVPFVQHPDYYEGDQPTFEAGVLTIPFLKVLPVPSPKSWAEPVKHFTNVVVHFDVDLDQSNTEIGASDVGGVDVVWKPASDYYRTPAQLTIPVVQVGNFRLYQIKIIGNTPSIIAATEATQ